MTSTPLLETPRQLAERAGISERQVRSLITSGRLAHVKIGGRVMVPAGAFELFLETETVKTMSRRNQGPRLRWLNKRQCYYITWTERGRSRERSTGTADREEAEIAFGEWLQRARPPSGPSDPAAVLVTDVLTDYATERGPKIEAPDRIAYAVLALTDFFEGNTVADVTTADMRPLCRQAGARRRYSAS